MKQKIERLPVESIRTNKNRGGLTEKKVDVLVKSLAEIGLKTPISVRLKKQGPTVVAGRHRLEAARRLKWKEIDCFIIRGDKTIAQLWTIAENLHRTELNAIQRADLIEDWERLLKDRQKAAQVAHPGGRQPHDKGVSATAKALGTSRDDVRRARSIAKISSKAKAAAKAVGLSNNTVALLKIAKKVGTKAQVKKVNELSKQKGRTQTRPSKTDKRHFRLLVDLFHAARDLKRAWDRASEAARRRFISFVLSGEQ